MSGIYTVPFSYTGNAPVSLCEIVAHANKVLVLLGINVSQTSDAGDAEEEIVDLIFKSGQSSAGSGGSASTPVSNDPSGGASAGFTARQADTTIPSGGTILTHMTDGWNVRMPFDKVLPETQQIILGGGRRASLEISGAADSLTVKGYLTVQEIG